MQSDNPENRILPLPDDAFVIPMDMQRRDLATDMGAEMVVSIRDLLILLDDPMEDNGDRP